jgi:hypothetical protein
MEIKYSIGGSCPVLNTIPLPVPCTTGININLLFYEIESCMLRYHETQKKN